MTTKNVKFELVSLWFQIWGAPFDMVSPKVAAEVGRRLRVVEEVEKRKKKEHQNLFKRVKIALPIAKPIQRGGFITGLEGGRTWVTYRYEQLSMFCHYCGLLGHDVRHCASFFVASKSGGNVVCQYGEWLKSLRARLWSPNKGGQGRSTHGAEAAEEVADRNGKQENTTAVKGDVSANINGHD